MEPKPFEGWNDLARASSNIFATREWCDAWWRHLGGGERWTVEHRDPDGSLFAVAPLYLTRRGPLRIVRFVGHGEADLLGPLCRPERRSQAAAAILRTLHEEGGWDVFLGQDLDQAARWGEAWGGTRIRGESSPVLAFEQGDWDEFLAARSRNFRYNLRRNRKKVEEAGAAFRLTDEASLHGDLESFFRLHSARWGGEGVFGDERVRAFHREFTAAALERGWLRMWVIEMEGGTAAIWYGFRFAGVEYYYQMGWDPKLEQLSLGTVVLNHSIEHALKDGMREYRFLRGAEAYKSRLANREGRIETIALARGPVGRAAVLAARLLRRGAG